uniref:Putative secreted protein n=1 Tax=Anopheles marajoara TaxID=58244 RepID=A0A2M4C9R1_9DIPT
MVQGRVWNNRVLGVLQVMMVHCAPLRTHRTPEPEERRGRGMNLTKFQCLDIYILNLTQSPCCDPLTIATVPFANVNVLTAGVLRKGVRTNYEP